MRLKILLLRAIGLIALAGIAASCDTAPGSRTGAPTRARGTELNHDGISISAPDSWRGRILYLDARGRRSIFQVANFRLPPNQGFEPPQELPAGHEDPIKAMQGDDVLIMVETQMASEVQRLLPVRITRSSLVGPDSSILPRNHVMATESGCFSGACLRITVDFATAPVSEDQIENANAVLQTLSIRRT